MGAGWAGACCGGRCGAGHRDRCCCGGAGSGGPAAASSGTTFVQAWGRGTEGQLGTGSTADQSSPADLTSLTQVAQVSGGYIHTLAVRADGTAWAWGDNARGELGNATTTG